MLLAPLPSRQCTWVNGELLRRRFLRPAQGRPTRYQPLRERLRLRQRIVPEEPNDRRNVPDSRIRCIRLPIDAALVHTDLLCDMLLEQFQSESSQPNVVADGWRLSRNP